MTNLQALIDEIKNLENKAQEVFDYVSGRFNEWDNAVNEAKEKIDIFISKSSGFPITEPTALGIGETGIITFENTNNIDLKVIDAQDKLFQTMFILDWSSSSNLDLGIFPNHRTYNGQFFATDWRITQGNGISINKEFRLNYFWFDTQGGADDLAPNVFQAIISTYTSSKFVASFINSRRGLHQGMVHWSNATEIWNELGTFTKTTGGNISGKILIKRIL